MQVYLLLALKGWKTCLSITVINLNLVFFIFCIFGSVQSVWLATQGSHQHYPKMCVNLQLKQINTFGIQVYLLLALKGRKTCLQVSNTVINLNVVFFPFFVFCKCSKCVVRHLGRPSTSPKNVFKSTLKMNNYVLHTGSLVLGHQRTENMSIKHCHQLEYCGFHFLHFLDFWKCSKCMARHLGKPPTSPKNVSKLIVEIDKYFWYTGLFGLGSERMENMPINHCHQLESCVFSCFLFSEVF